MSELWNDLLSCLELRLVADPAVGGEVFEGDNQHLEYHRLFGGQLLGQIARASALACPGKDLKSMHVLFPREGRADEPVRYEVTRHHEGRSFASLTVTARQSSGPIATAVVSLHTPEDGATRQSLPGPDPLLDESHRTHFDLIPWETRSTTDLDTTGTAAPELDLWMRTPDVDPALAPALLAYATDLNLIGTALLPVDGLCQRGNGTEFTSAVTSHNLWFHQPFRTDDWLLLRQHSPLTAQGRCFGRGDVLTASGDLVASFAQEALLRLP
ncbi:acyl-CoA thioesterase domain-containing protein [Rhodococcus sp. Q]|uniref:acyl-CoA thioesterase n=1 Tax=Rhodococcus sp. Q TaxID=2502252 RepID=UPI0010F4492A|nr:acyl-CoA thioesterase domain-containing protein [Rhodococcus sp. Q]